MREFIILKNAQAAFETVSASCSTGTRPSFWKKAAGCEAQNWHPYSTEVKNEWTYISTSNTPSWHVHDEITNFKLWKLLLISMSLKFSYQTHCKIRLQPIGHLSFLNLYNISIGVWLCKCTKYYVAVLWNPLIDMHNLWTTEISFKRHTYTHTHTHKYRGCAEALCAFHTKI
jgi:hypothetical protein